MAARTKNNAINLEITNTNDGFDIVGGNNNTGSIGVYSGSIDIIADSSATNLTYTFPSVSDILVGRTASQTLTNKTLTDPSIDGITEEPTFARVLLYDLSSQKLGYTASSAFGGGGGGGGTPGGSDKQIQYNESGLFGGESNLTWDYTANVFSVTGSTILSGSITAAGLTEQNYTRVLLSDTNGNLAYTSSAAFGGGGGGAQGPQGPQGNQGNQGRQGPLGPQGNQGNQGRQGPLGPQGNQGSQGNQGLKGDQGFQGPQGPAGGGGGGPTTGVSRSFYMPAIGGEYNTSVTETTSSFGGFTSRYLLMQLNETPSAVDYTLSMPNEWLTTSNINVRLHLVVSGSTTGGPIFGIGMTSVDDNESFSSISSPTYVTASANYSGYTALDKYDLKINNITIAGSPTTSSIILMKIRRETDDEFTHSIPFIGFEIQYTENTTLPSSF